MNEQIKELETKVFHHNKSLPNNHILNRYPQWD